jgi:hypothetical protein
MPRKRKDPRNDLVVQATNCEDFVLVPRRLIESLKDEINSLRDALRLPDRVWESPQSVDAVARPDGISKG